MGRNEGKGTGAKGDLGVVRDDEPRLAPPSDLRVAELRAGAEHLIVLAYSLSRQRGRSALTPAELRVVIALHDGKSNAEIADAHGTSIRTVANQVASAFRKLGVNSRAELVALGVALR
jgi:DNA-binding CsgD family transcriptional regulator